MKRVILQVAIILTVLALIIVNQFVMKKTTTAMCEKLETAANCATSGDSSGCTAAVEEFAVQYDKYKGYFHMLTGHDALDKLEQDCETLRIYSARNNVEGVLIKCKEAGLVLEDIYRSDSFSLENIF